MDLTIITNMNKELLFSSLPFFSFFAFQQLKQNMPEKTDVFVLAGT